MTKIIFDLKEFKKFLRFLWDVEELIYDSKWDLEFMEFYVDLEHKEVRMKKTWKNDDMEKVAMNFFEGDNLSFEMEGAE